jgi:hypothetical protein
MIHLTIPMEGSPQMKTFRYIFSLALFCLLISLATTPATAQRQRACCTFTLPTWQGSFSYQGGTYPYTMIGSDPALGGTTYTSVEIIPIDLQFVDSNGVLLSELNINTPMCNNSNTGVSLALNSPLFQNYPFYAGGTYLGTTQYTDAFQRANFNQASGSYHVLLGGVTVQPVQTISISPANGSVAATAIADGCTSWGRVDFNFFDNTARSLVSSLVVPSYVLPIFLVRNITFTLSGRDYASGWHGSIGTTAGSPTYMVASYYDVEIYPNTNFQDTFVLSHELAEWLDDPYGNNPTPGWIGPSGCQSNLEVGDPVYQDGFIAPLNAFNYHLTNLAFLSWFAQQSPSTAVNGWYTFTNGVFSNPATRC